MSKRYTLLLSFVLVLFVSLYAMLCFYCRLATDDYYFIYDVKTHGIITGVTSQYMAWCGRFAATFFMDLFYGWFGVNQTSYLLLPSGSFILLLIGLYFCFTNVLSSLSIQLGAKQKWMLSLSFVAMLFFLSTDIGESWFWYCSMSSYLWSIIAFIWGIAFLYNERYSYLSGILSLLCFVYVGGSSEVYSVLFGILLSLLLFYNYKQAVDLKTFIKTAFNKRLVLIYCALGISFLIFLIAPGNYLRDGLFPEHQFFYSFFITAKSIVKFGALYLPFRVPAIIAFSVPFLVAGDLISNKNAFSISFKHFFYRVTVLFCILLFVFFFLVAYVMVETGPARLWFLVSFLLSIYCALIFFYAGNKGVLNSKNLTLAKNISLITGFILLGYHLIVQYPIASKYANANDQRIEHIMALNGSLQNDTIIALSPLPPSGMLYSSEIAADTNHFTNKELLLGYNLKFHVVVNR